MQPYLYSIIDSKIIHDMMETFYKCLNLPVQLLDEEGNILDTAGNTTSFCSNFKKLLHSDDDCVKLHAAASKQAIALGETYIFSCHANLNHIVFPLVNKNVLFGSILAGPFLMDEPDSLLISDIARHYPMSTENLLELYDESRNIPVIPPATVTSLSKLLYYLFSGLIVESLEQLNINQTKLHQQSRINESIQMYKTSGASQHDSYPYDKEKELILKVKTGNAKEAKALLNDLLGYVFFSEGNKLDIIKSRAIELCSLLSRAAIEGGATSDGILKINNQFLQSLEQIKNIDDLCYKLTEIIDAFTESTFDYIPTKNTELMKKAIYYISQNYSKNISLDDVAEQVHLNPSYFSSLFKHSSGSSFKEYLNMIRIEESKRLLANTDYSIIDIAVATGFEDQSYFSKVFKKYTGLTPKQYRQ